MHQPFRPCARVAHIRLVAAQIGSLKNDRIKQIFIITIQHVFCITFHADVPRPVDTAERTGQYDPREPCQALGRRLLLRARASIKRRIS